MKITKSQPPQWGMGKTVKRDLKLIKKNFGAKKNFEKKFFFEKFLSHFGVPGPDLALKHRGVLRLEVLQGLHRNYFVFCLNFRQVNEINPVMGRKGLFKQNGHFGGIFSHKSPPGDTNQIPKMGER